MSRRDKILIVDDIPDNLDLLANSLGDEFDFIFATNGAEAIELALGNSPPDLVLLDIMMPGIDGYEVCRRIKSDTRGYALPIIFVTALTGEHDEEKGLELGAVDYITKPISPPIIKARIHNHLLLKKQQDQLKESISLMQHEADILSHKAELGIMAGSLAHDIANILSHFSMADFIEKQLPIDLKNQDKIVEILQTINNSMELGAQLCHGFTSYLSGLGEEAEPQDIRPLLQPLDIFACSYKGRLDHEFNNDLPLLLCKGYQLKRVFTNLFLNATQALEKTPDPHITVRLWAVAERIYCSIRDNGFGIPGDVLPRIFDECFTTKTEGTGLGLFLVRQIVDDHAGTIEVNSVVGEGTTFTLSFPAYLNKAA